MITLTGAGRGGGGGSAFSPTSTESANFLARATTITSSTDKTNCDTLISGLVSDGIFSKLDLLYIWAAPDRTAAVLNLISSSFPATENGSVSFSAYHGYTGDASSFYLDPAFNPTTASSPKFVQDSATVGVYILSNRSTGQDWWAVGSADDGGVAFLPLSASGPNTNGNRLNSAFGASGGGTNAQAAWNYTRTASNLQSIFKNDGTTATYSNSDTSITPHNAGIFFFSDTAGFGNTGDQMAAGWIGSGLTGAESVALNGRINTYMAAYGINVY